MSEKSYGLLAVFDTPGELLHAASETRRAGFRRWDVHTPFPVHGMDAAMGLKRSPVPRLTLAGGALGFFGGNALIYWSSVINYPIIIGGKPLYSPMFAFPVAYELTILLAAFGTILGIFVFNRLPRHYHPVLKWEKVEGITNDKFILVIEAADPNFDPERTRKFFTELGAKEITELEE